MSEELPTLNDGKKVMQEFFDKKPVATLTKHEKKQELDHWQRQLTGLHRVETERRLGLKGEVVGWGGAAIGLVGLTIAVYPPAGIVALCVAISGFGLAAVERYDNFRETERGSRLIEASKLAHSRRDELILSMEQIPLAEQGTSDISTSTTGVAKAASDSGSTDV